MRVKSIILSLVCAAPLMANAGMTIVNNTNQDATGQIGRIQCTTDLGDKGVIKAHDILKIPKLAMRMYCHHSCKAEVYMSNHCEGASIATVDIDEKSGVTSITNHNNEGYTLSGSGSTLSINGGNFKWYQKLLKFI